jgi:mannose-6-phosphate isomerase-like protein (cupin superfamily)
MLYPELDNSMAHDLCDIVAYRSGQIVSKTIALKPTGTITVFAFAEGEETFASISAFDNLIHVIDGIASVRMNERSIDVRIGQVLVIPAHTINKFVSKVRFKMLSTTIKSGFEEMI